MLQPQQRGNTRYSTLHTSSPRHRRSEKPPPVSLADVSLQTPESETQHSSLNTQSPFHGELPSTNRDLIRKTPPQSPRFCLQISVHRRSTWRNYESTKSINRLQSILQLRVSCMIDTHRSLKRRGSEAEENIVVDHTSHINNLQTFRILHA